MEFQSSALIPNIPEFLLDIDKSLLTVREFKLERCHAIVNMCEENIVEFGQLDYQCTELKKNEEEKVKTLQLEIEKIKQEVCTQELQQKTLTLQISAEEEKLTKITANFIIEDELNDLMSRVYALKNEIVKKRTDIKSEVDVFKRGIAFYKKYLQCNVIYLSEGTLIFTLSPSAKNLSEASEFIKFTTKDNGKTFQYVEMSPKLNTEKRLVEVFHETGDIQGLILEFFKAMKLQSGRKVLGEKN